MARCRSVLFASLGLVALAGLASPAEAVVYCNGPGLPVGCVARPVARVVRPVAPVVRPVAPVVRATPGVGAPGVGVAPGVGAPGVGVRPGTPANRGGPVNRAGRR